MIKYTSLNQYLKNTFGCKVYKIAINAGFTCPNRDGTLGTGGCIFCSGTGSGDFAEDPGLTITEQIEAGKKRVAAKAGEGKFIAYFQAFTNTYAPTERLKALYKEALAHPDVVALSIATRPDCLPEEVLDLLEACNRIKPVWVELGLQTIHENIAKYIRRGYSLESYDEAVRNLKARKLSVITHVILGLPGETKDDMEATVRYVCDHDTDGIKLQLLHILKGTDLAEEYLAGKVPVMTEEEYIDLVTDLLRIIPKNVVIHRMTGDGPKKDLLAPLWSADKKHVLNALQKAIREG
ncbi:MAG: TIGR01212 family radical SAM protein [Lachnospiraceae bacterium]|nr:TIGR01212 family radical SAM protein [Lachnospiraceae bacterium]